MLPAVNMGWLHPASLVLSRRRCMRRLRLFSCRRILACTRNPSWFRGPRNYDTHLDSENTEGFRVFQQISPPTSGAFAWLGTRLLGPALDSGAPLASQRRDGMCHGAWS